MDPTINTRTEPAIVIAALEALLLAIVPALVYLFGWSTTAASLILAIVGPVIALLSAVWVRARVTPIPRDDPRDV